MPINQFTATTGRKKPSGAVDTINALAPGYLQSLYNKKQDAVTQKGFDLTASQMASTNAFNKAQLELSKKQTEAAKDQADTAAKIGIAGLGIQAASLLPDSVTSALSGVGAKAYDLLGKPIVSGVQSLLGIAPAAESAAALLPGLQAGTELANIVGAGNIAGAGNVAGVGNIAGAANVTGAANVIPAAAAAPTTFAGGLSTAVGNILGGTATSGAGGVVGSLGLSASLGALAPAIPIAAGVYAIGQIMDQVLGEDPTKPWSPEQLETSGKQNVGWIEQGNKMGLDLALPSTPMTADNFDYWSSDAGQKEFRDIQLNTQKAANEFVSAGNPDSVSVQKKISTVTGQKFADGPTAQKMAADSPYSAALAALRDIKF